jgi:hypothetical protein
MARLLFKRAGGGNRAARGQLINDLQKALETHGASPGEIDGIYGGDTERAVNAWKAGSGQPEDGKVSDDDWRALSGGDIPPVQLRALQLTAAFEGHGFTKAVGNFDNAYITWGIIGFTLKHGEIPKIIHTTNQRHPGVVSGAFGPLEGELMAGIEGSAAEQEAFGNSISVPPRRYDLLPDWAAAFAKLGDHEGVRAIQIERAGKYFDIARRDADNLGLESEIGLSLTFDIAVQNGGVSSDERSEIERKTAAAGASSELERRVIVANVVAENSIDRWVENVRARKRTIANGAGEVHGARYDLADWGLGEFPRG